MRAQGQQPAPQCRRWRATPFRVVRALVFGHFGEFNDGLIKLASDISRSIAHQHHRALGFKSVKGGLSRAKAGVMRRLSMVALRCTARQLLRGLAIVSPSCIPVSYTHLTLPTKA